MEFGVQLHTIPQFEALFRRYPFDFIILSIHQVEDKEFWTQDFQKGRTQQEYNERYYEEMLRVVQRYKNYSVLGHMDLIKRYDKEGIYPFEKVRSLVAEILKIVIADGKGIEVNTSSHRYGLTESMPSTELLRLYRDLGGSIVTIGSDSHAPAYLGTYLEEAKRQLAELDFQTFCTYERMRPVLVYPGTNRRAYVCLEEKTGLSCVFFLSHPRLPTLHEVARLDKKSLYWSRRNYPPSRQTVNRAIF